MNFKLFGFIKKMLGCMAIIGLVFLLTDCKSDVDMKKQQNAFYVDANGDLLNKKGALVKKAGAFKLEGGFYVDSSGEPIKRNIDKAKEKINEKVGAAKDKLGAAAANTKDKVGTAATNTKDKLGSATSNKKETLGAAAASLSKDNVKANFNKLFNTKAVGTVYALSDIGFDKNSHRINKMSKEEVEGLAAALKEHPDSRIQVQVHTADGKNKSDCKKIADLRAKVVKDMLVTLGVKADQISSKGLGLTTEDAAKAVANTVEVVVEK